MPYVKVGRYKFNLADVEVAVDSAATEGALTVRLKSGYEIELDREAAAMFVAIWDEHTATRAAERAPPRVVEPRIIRPSEKRDATARSSSGTAVPPDQ